jgi:signal transduction histidine kinase
LQQVAQLLCGLLDAGRVGISVYDHSAQTRTLLVWYPYPTEDRAAARIGIPRPLHDYLYRTRLLKERRTVALRVEDESPEAEEIRETLVALGDRMAVFTPLLSRSEVVGDITFSISHTDWSYANPDRQLVETIAAQLASSLELGRLLHAEQTERKRAQGLQEVARVVNRTLNPKTVMHDVLTELAKIIDFDGAAVWLREGDDLVMTQSSGIALRHQGLRIPVGTRSAINRVFATGQVQAVGDVLADELWTGWFPEDGLRAWIGAPMIAEGQVIGALGLDRLRPGITEDDRILLQALAELATTAVVNARLFNQVQAAAAIEERERLARELHDAVTQTIFSANLLAEVLPLQLVSSPEQAQGTVEKLKLLTHSALSEMRSLLAEMRPTGLTETSLDSLIRLLTDALSARSSVLTTLHVKWQGKRLPDDVQLAFYRSAQELLNNIAKHADAAHATIELSGAGGGARLTVSDDGRGFDPLRERPGHYGLQIVQERAAAIGATVTIESTLGKGSRIVLDWQAPLTESGQEDGQ